MSASPITNFVGIGFLLVGVVTLILAVVERLRTRTVRHRPAPRLSLAGTIDGAARRAARELSPEAAGAAARTLGGQTRRLGADRDRTGHP
jgi:hypothetical protein